MEQPIATTQIFNADCLEKMKDLDDKSVDLIFCDLPYGQTSCAWDSLIDLDLFWKEVMRIKKLNTPIFFTTTTKFGVSLIQSAPKKCFFRYDLVWVKSAPAGFLCAKKMPMRKHEMIYVFYEKLPFYDLSSHSHKFIKSGTKSKEGGEMVVQNKSIYHDKEVIDYKDRKGGPMWDPPLPVSVVKEDKNIIDGETYNTKNRKKPITREKGDKYDPPLPVSVVKEEKTQISKAHDADLYGATTGGTIGNVHGTNYDPPLPVSIVKEVSIDKDFSVEVNNSTYGTLQIKQPITSGPRWDPPLPVSVVKEVDDVYDAKERFKNGKLKKHARHLQKGDESIYDPPLPVSVVKEDSNIIQKIDKNNSIIKKQKEDNNYNKTYKNDCLMGNDFKNFRGGVKIYEPALPVSIVKDESSTIYNNKGKSTTPITKHPVQGQTTGQPRYDPPLPDSMLEIKSTRGKHSTEKPVALMEWVLKYYSKEGDMVLDPTCGSGSTGVACKNMNRNFIGIEMDEDIFKVAENRLK